MRNINSKKSKRILRKVMNKLKRMKAMMTKRITSPICPLKPIEIMKSELEKIDLKRFRCGGRFEVVQL